MSLGAGISAAVVTILISAGGWERQEDLKCVQLFKICVVSETFYKGKKTEFIHISTCRQESVTSKARKSLSHILTTHFRIFQSMTTLLF
jgi:hypothetical protein